MNATILVVDHHEGSLEILRRDIARRYGADYEVIPASSTADAIAVQKDLVSEGRSIALVIAYQWMTGMTGIELLSGCRAFHPGAMRALMIDVGDLPAEEPIVRALTLNHIDYYFGKPWASPEEELYPTTGDALRVWSSAHLPRLEKVKLVGDPSSSLMKAVSRGMELNNVGCGVYAPGSPQTSALMRENDLPAEDLPAAVLYDGRVLRDLSTMKVARAIRREPLSLRRWQRNPHPDGGHCHRRFLSTARGAGGRQARRERGVLRSRHIRGSGTGSGQRLRGGRG